MNQPKFRVPVRPGASGTSSPPPSDDAVRQFAAGAAMVTSQAPSAAAAPPAPTRPDDSAATAATPPPFAPRPAKPIRLNVDIDPVIYERLTHLARAKGRKLTVFVREMIARELG